MYDLLLAMIARITHTLLLEFGLCKRTDYFDPRSILVAIFVTSFTHNPWNWNQVYRSMRGSSARFCLQSTHYDCIDPF
jgi:hypothetical protein